MGLGRLKRTLKEKCPDCGRGNLQLRVEKKMVMVKGTEVEESKDYKYCPSCQYEEHKSVNKKQEGNKTKRIGEEWEI